MISVSDDNVFGLSNAQFSYVFRISPEGILEHLYYGAPIKNPLSVKAHFFRTKRDNACEFQGHKNYSLLSTPQEYPVFGTSDFRYPAFHAKNSDGNTVFSFHYKHYEILDEKPVLDGLPSSRGGGAQTLKITLEDPLYKVEVDLLYTIWKDFSVLARSACFRNNGTQKIHLQNIFSSSLDLPPGDYEALHLHGTWSREFNEERVKLPTGRFVIESARGTSSAAHNPFLAIMEKGTGEDHGRVYASTLIYSGNFAISAETGEFEDLRLMIGINPFNFEWSLSPGEAFHTPEALHVFARNGLRDMSAKWHDFIRAKVSPEGFKNKPRPTYLNTWEAAYFDVTEDKVLTLVDKAVEIGVDMLVLDDGWFEGRQDDSSSLGDWRADKTRFPSGIPSLAKRIKAKGLKFGVWFEPEMVNPNSDLFRSHPEWVMQVPGRKASLGRNQLTLDLSRYDVQDYIFTQLNNILSCGDIDYVKWDMNRNMTEVGSSNLSPDRQGEVSHRYILGLYKLLTRLTKKYPDILFENCASGGNRFDLGMLSFMPQGWISDMCDPIGRLQIVNGASYLYPLDTMAAYIGPSPNHQNGRVSSIQTRFLAGAFCAARGISLNKADIDVHAPELQHWMQFAKETAADMVSGRFHRLLCDQNEVCWQYSAAGGETVYLTYFHCLSAPNQPFKHIRMTDLDPNATYILHEDGEAYDGDTLMQSGLALPYVTTNQFSETLRYMEKGDFSSYLFVFEKRN